MINAQRQRELGLDGLSQFDPTVFGEKTTNPPPDVARIEQDRRKKPEVVIHADGATATNVAFAVHFDGNLNRSDAVTLVLGDHQIQMHVVALAASDASGNRVWLGHLKDCQGEVGPPDDQGRQSVTYSNGFDGGMVDATISYYYGVNVLEQNIRLESLILPMGIDPASARIEAWNELFQSDPPRKEEHSLALRTDAATLKAHGPVQATDETLSLANGLLRVVAGKAFLLPKPSGTPALLPPLPVAKSYREYNDNGTQRGFLVEAIDWISIRNLMAQLDKPAKPVQQSKGPSPSRTAPRSLAGRLDQADENGGGQGRPRNRGGLGFSHHLQRPAQRQFRLWDQDRPRRGRLDSAGLLESVFGPLPIR